MTSFKERFTFEQRLKEAKRIRKKYSDRVPIIVEKAKKNDVPDIDKYKFLVPTDLTIAQFICVIRKRIRLTPDNALYIFINNMLPPQDALVGQIYKEQAEKDQFLYCIYGSESTFG